MGPAKESFWGFTRRHATICLAVISVLVLATACSGDDGGSGGGSGPTASATGSGSATSGATGVDVTLEEFAIIPSPASVKAGEVSFHVTNAGPQEVHEFVVLKTDLAVDALPTKSDGSANEEGQGITPIDEIEDIAVGATQTLTVSLDAGNYVLICNIVNKKGGETVSHYQQGMRAALTVT
ncbi:MAG TPA: hypothetical protein VKC55_06255 [Actinomycetota bacterium]|nr:hypothetical protein [Actinomycetota bacterium]